jgi:hypothetical protein
LPKNWTKILAFSTQAKLNYAKNDHNIGVWEKRQFCRQNCQKPQKIVIITSTPGTNVMIKKIFSPKNWTKILPGFAQTTASFCQDLIICNIGF